MRVFVLWDCHSRKPLVGLVKVIVRFYYKPFIRLFTLKYLSQLSLNGAIPGFQMLKAKKGL